jgi:hypothetical protein
MSVKSTEVLGNRTPRQAAETVWVLMEKEAKENATPQTIQKYAKLYVNPEEKCVIFFNFFDLLTAVI